MLTFTTVYVKRRRKKLFFLEICVLQAGTELIATRLSWGLLEGRASIAPSAPLDHGLTDTTMLELRVGFRSYSNSQRAFRQSVALTN